MTIAALGIDIGGTAIKYGIVTSGGEVLHAAAEPTLAEEGAEALLAKLVGIAARAKDRCAEAGVTLQGIGIGTAGQVDAANGLVAGATPNLPGWSGIPLARRMAESTGLPVVIDNDVNMIAYGEAWLGAGYGLQDFLCVALGTGVGGCIIMDGEIVRGRDGFAGEFGHMTIRYDGRDCNCGNKGCWEQYASVSALIRMMKESDNAGEWSSPHQLFEAAAEGSPTAMRILDEYTESIAAGLAGLIHVLNPGAIILGGAITAQGDALMERIHNKTVSRTMPVFAKSAPVQILPAVLGNEAGFIGAARASLTQHGADRRS